MSSKKDYLNVVEAPDALQTLEARVNGNGRYKGSFSMELLQQFQHMGVTVPLPHSFADAISPQRGENGKEAIQAHANGHAA